MAQAGAYPLVTTTGDQLIEHIGPREGDTILITGALGSVGRTAVYVAKQRGAYVIAGVRGRQKAAAAELRADQVLAIDDDREIDALRVGLDSIGDTVDHEVIAKLIPKLKPGGVLGSVLGKPKAGEGKNIGVEAFTAQPDAHRLRELATDLGNKQFTIPIARTFRLSEVREAPSLAENCDVQGKILLIP